MEDARPVRFAWLKRLSVFSGIVIAVYVAIESAFDGPWYFGLIWRGKGLQYKYWRDAVFYLIEDEIYYVIIYALGLFALAFCLNVIRKRFLPFFDENWLWLSLVSILLISLSTMMNYHENVRKYEALEYYPRRLAALSEQWRSITHASSVPEPPIDFEYTDDETIEKMYSQLGPSLIEEKRTIEASGGEGAKVEVGGGAAKVEGQVERGNRTESVQKRVSFSTDRKCIELMHYTSDHHSLHTYSDSGNWILDRIWFDLMQTLTEDAALLKPDAPVTKRALERLRIDEPIPTTPAEVEKQGRKDIDRLEAELNSELTNLKSPVLITGVFTVRVDTDRSLIISHTFSTKPSTVVFETSAPRSPRLSELVHERKLILTVFGTVVTPLTKEGRIAIRAIAIY